jgi:type II secretory pathway pseudopilin PulG
MERRVVPAQMRRGFTLMEMMLVLLVIFALIGLLVGGIKMARGTAKSTADRADANSLKQAVSQFDQQMGFKPPLVADFGKPPSSGGVPLFNGTSGLQPLVYSVSNPTDRVFLRTVPTGSLPPDPTSPDMRFSLYSMPYYVIGALDTPRTGANPPVPIDGVNGPGFRTVRRDGTFETAGKVFAPFFDVGKRPTAIYAADQANGRVVLRDRNGIAYRYYHWEHGNPNFANSEQITSLTDVNVPMILGMGRYELLTPADVAKEYPELRDAKYVIVGAGPDGLFGDEDLVGSVCPNHPQAMSLGDMAQKLGMSGDLTDAKVRAKLRQKAMSDNIVEVLK